MTDRSQDESRSSSEPKWILRRGEVEASFSIDRLRLHARAGRLRRDDMVHREDQPEWRRAGDVREVFASRSTKVVTVVTAAAISIGVVALGGAILPRIPPLVCGDVIVWLWGGGVFVGIDNSHSWAAAAIVALCSLWGWIPWIWFFQFRPAVVVYVCVPLWIPGTILLSIPALRQPWRFAPGALLRRFVDFLRLSPRA
jgi:hypothetical protein